MLVSAVQHERGPRSSTLRRQQLHYYSDARLASPSENVLNLSVTKFENPSIDHSQVPFLPPAVFPCASLPPNSQIPALQFPPAFIPNLLNPSAICETAAQLLFVNVQWVQTIPFFLTLPLHDQILLLEESWLDLFLLGAAQFLPLFDLRSVVQACGILSENSQQEIENFLKQVNDFQEIVKRIQQFQLDAHEYACLRTIVLFRTTFDKPSSSVNEKKLPVDIGRIGVIQEDAQMRLNKHICTIYPKQPLRFGKILLLVSATFRTISANTIERLFFKKVIRDTPIVAIISNMYKNKFVAKQ